MSDVEPVPFLASRIRLMVQFASFSTNLPTLERTFSSFVYIAVFDDRVRCFGGKQCIVTSEGYVIPLIICNRLPGLDLQPPSDGEWRDLPHIVTSSDEEWDPSKFDD